MIKTDSRLLAVAIALSALAGFVDALGFLSLGGFFVAFMSGNSTRLAVAVASGDMSVALIPGMVIALFIFGVVIGSLVGRFRPADREPTVMGTVTAVLIVGALLHECDQELLSVGAIVIAMGAVNTVFEADGATSIPITYMTGTLVRLAQSIAGALTGGPKTTWMRYLALWLGLVGGAVCGAYMYARMGLSGLWISVAWAGAIGVATAVMKLRRREAPANIA